MWIHVRSFKQLTGFAGVVLPLLAQSSLLWQITFAYTILGKKLAKVQILGGLLTVVGVCTAAWPSGNESAFSEVTLPTLSGNETAFSEVIIHYFAVHPLSHPAQWHAYCMHVA